jgi:hypothetical protein
MVDVDGEQGDPRWLEEMMDQAKLEALAEAVIVAHRALKSAAERWTYANGRLSSLPEVSSEAQFDKDMGEALNPVDPRRPAEIKGYIKDWANRTAARRTAAEAKNLADEEVKKCSEAAHVALEQVVKFIREST